MSFLSEYYNNPIKKIHNNPILVINYSGIKPEDINNYIELLCNCIDNKVDK